MESVHGLGMLFSFLLSAMLLLLLLIFFGGLLKYFDHSPAARFPHFKRAGSRDANVQIRSKSSIHSPPCRAAAFSRRRWQKSGRCCEEGLIARRCNSGYVGCRGSAKIQDPVDHEPESVRELLDCLRWALLRLREGLCMITVKGAVSSEECEATGVV